MEIRQDFAHVEKIISQINPKTIKKLTSIAIIKDFLEHICYNGNVILAAKSIDISPLRIYRVIASDEYLKKSVEIALDISLEVAEGMLYQRAVNGIDEDVYKGGESIGKKKKYSDRALTELLRVNLPQKYGSKIIYEGKKKGIDTFFNVDSPLFDDEEDEE